MLCVLAATPSCTAVGAVVGFAVPHYATETPAPDATDQSSRPLKIGDDVRLKTVGGSDWVHGKYRGERGGALLLGNREGEQSIAHDQISILQIKRGNYSDEGAVIGLGVDMVVIVVVGSVLAAKSRSDGTGSGSTIDFAH